MFYTMQMSPKHLIACHIYWIIIPFPIIMYMITLKFNLQAGKLAWMAFSGTTNWYKIVIFRKLLEEIHGRWWMRKPEIKAWWSQVTSNFNMCFGLACVSKQGFLVLIIAFKIKVLTETGKKIKIKKKNTSFHCFWQILRVKLVLAVWNKWQLLFCFVLKTNKLGPGKMVQQAKEIPASLTMWDWALGPTWWKKRTTSQSLPSKLHMNAISYAPKPSKQISVKINKSAKSRWLTVPSRHCCHPARISQFPPAVPNARLYVIISESSHLPRNVAELPHDLKPKVR